MIELINFILGVIIVIGAGLFAWTSTVLVSEKKARYHAGTHDYYDNPIKKEKK
tara:strand:+ start:589 stop:747 length:159 start_codon:yes stop_codon:yes gene_type:complete